MPGDLAAAALPKSRLARSMGARRTFEKMATSANHLELFAEQLGNFPQAFTHLALISGRYPPHAYRDLLLQSASGIKNVLSLDTAHLRTSQPTVTGAL